MMKNQGCIKRYIATVMAVLMMFSSAPAAIADGGVDAGLATATDLPVVVEEQQESEVDAAPVLMARTADEDDEKAYDSYVSIETEDDHLIIKLRGINEQNYEDVLSEIENNLTSVLDGTPHKIENADFLDPEKYYLIEYDSKLCYAATAANMLWMSGYAQNAINPITQTEFQNVDEVFDYFRDAFTTDLGGNPFGTIKLFVNGRDYWEEHRSMDTEITGKEEFYWHLERDDNELTLEQALKCHYDEYDEKRHEGIPKEIPHFDDVDFDEEKDFPALLPTEPEYGFIEIGEKLENIEWLDRLRDYSIGLSIKHKDIYGKDDMSHAVTVVGLIKDDQATELKDKYKAIIIADSDNDVRRYILGDELEVKNQHKAALEKLGPDVTDKESETILNDIRAEYAANLPNSYTIYELDYHTISYGLIDSQTFSGWFINKFNNDDRTYIDGLYYLANKIVNIIKDVVPPTPEDTATTTTTTSSDEKVVNENAVIARYNYIRSVMARENWIVYSPTNWIYTQAEDDTFDVYVRAKIAALKAVYLDDELVSAENGDFELVNCHNGMFIIVFNEEGMKALDAGTHTLKFQIDGYDEIVKELTIQ